MATTERMRKKRILSDIPLETQIASVLREARTDNEDVEWNGDAKAVTGFISRLC